MILVKVERSMLLLSEIYGYLFEDVIRTCMATGDPSIYAELCTFPERAACTHFLS